VTVSVLIGLLLQGGALWFVNSAIRGDWLRRPAALLLATAVINHGFTEVMQWVWPGRNNYRAWIEQPDLDDWMLVVSTAVVLYAVAYVLVLRIRGGSGRQQLFPAADYVKGVPLRALLAFVVPLLVVTWQGVGVLAPAALGKEATRDNYLTVGLAQQFLVPVSAMAGVVVLVRYGIVALIPLLAVQGAMISMTGTRTMVVATCLVTLIGANLCGIRPTRKQVVWAGVIMIFFTVIISSTRFVSGRETFAEGRGAEGRAEGLRDGFSALGDKSSHDAVLDDFVYRFDCNTFGSIVLANLRSGAEPIGLATVENSVLAMVPSFLFPEKLDRSLEFRNEEAYIDDRLGLSPDVDWLPGVFGVMICYFGPLGLFGLAGLLGALFALLEAASLSRPTAVRFVLGLGLAQCSLSYEGGPQVLFVVLRGTLVLMALLLVSGALRDRVTRVRARAVMTAPRRSCTGPAVLDAAEPSAGRLTPGEQAGQRHVGHQQRDDDGVQDQAGG
jgi:hypothetical protein